MQRSSKNDFFNIFKKMSTVEFIKQCNEDIQNQETEKQISERCTLKGLFTFTVPDNIKELTVELKDKSIEAFLTGQELAKLIIEYISSKTDDIKLLVQGNLTEDAQRILAFAIKFFQDTEITEQGDKIKVVIKDSFEIIKILTEFGKFVAGCCKSTLRKIYKYLKQEIKKGLEEAKKLIETLRETFLKYAKETFAKLISAIYNTYTAIKTRDITDFEIDDYVIKCPDYLNKGNMVDTWKAVIAELESQI